MKKNTISDSWINQAFQATLQAGTAILEVYKMADQEIAIKADHSPITLADRKADTIIKATLQPTGIPVFTEESSDVPYNIRKKWDKYWLVDPLDGTKEFIRHNDEFTVNIALIEDHIPTFGIIFIPVYKQLYFAIKGRGAYRMDHISEDFSNLTEGNKIIQQAVRLSDKQHTDIRIAVSRSHLSPETKTYIHERIGDRPYKMISAGSSLKFCRVAEGEADLYPRLGPTMEWDIAAGTIIVTESGGTVLQYDGKPLTFNRENLLNPWFVVASGEMGTFVR